MLALFAGQRIAKDYAGAASIALFAALAMIGMLGLRCWGSQPSSKLRTAF
ncbi:MAG: hypothetical protein OHK0011_11480 [Turneriella sp.]